MRKNVASQIVAFQMNSTAAGTPVTTGTPTVYVTKDGGVQATGTGTSTHEGNGQWTYAPVQAETNANHVAFTMALTNAISQTVNVYPVAYDPTSAADLGVTSLIGHIPQTADHTAAIADVPTVTEFNARTLLAASYFDPATDTVANVTTVATTTTNTDMRGTDGALTDKAGFSLSTAGILAIWHQLNSAIVTVGSMGKLLKDEITAARMATLTDWINGGRLDLLLDAIPTTAMRGTDGANTTTPPTVGAIADQVWDEATSAHVVAGSTGKKLGDIPLSGSGDWTTGEKENMRSALGITGTKTAATGGQLQTLDTVADGIQADLSNATDGLGALKTGIDAIPTTAMRGTDGANTTTPPTAAAIADAVHDEPLSGHITAGTAGKKLTDIPTTAMRGTDGVDTAPMRGTDSAATAASLATAQSDLDTLTGTDGATLATSQANYAPSKAGDQMALINDAITAAKVATDALGSLELAQSAIDEIADGFLDRDMSSGTDSGTEAIRTPRQALRFLRNQWDIVAGTLTVRKEDDTTQSWTSAITTTAGDPVSKSNPTDL